MWKTWPQRISTSILLEEGSEQPHRVLFASSCLSIRVLWPLTRREATRRGCACVCSTTPSPPCAAAQRILFPLAAEELITVHCPSLQLAASSSRRRYSSRPTIPYPATWLASRTNRGWLCAANQRSSSSAAQPLPRRETAAAGPWRRRIAASRNAKQSACTAAALCLSKSSRAGAHSTQRVVAAGGGLQILAASSRYHYRCPGEGEPRNLLMQVARGHR